MSLIASRLIFPTRGVIEPATSFFQLRAFAARKGTRERKAKKKAPKVVEVKVGFIPHNIRKREKLLAARPSRKWGDYWKKEPVDDVYTQKYFKWARMPFKEAVECHRETHHPSIYNKPNENLHVTVELNMQGVKQTRFVDNFTKTVAIPHKFEHGEERNIIAFSKMVEVQREALDAGAQLAGGSDLIKQIHGGGVVLQNFNYIVAHPDILPELSSLRGLMKRKYPTPKNGCLDVDLGAVTSRFLNGINYTAQKDEYEKDFGVVETVVGTLNMGAQELEDNFVTLIRDIYEMRPRREGDFITRCLVWSPPSSEKFMIDHGVYLETQSKKTEHDEDEEEEEGEKVAL